MLACMTIFTSKKKMYAKFHILALLLVAVGSVSANERAAVTGFKDMVEALTGRPAIQFNGYGNWCGIGGSGETVDGVDACCKTHDLCYEAAGREACKNENHKYIYIAPYGYEANKSRKSAKCTPGSGVLSKTLKYTSPSKFECGNAICVCDIKAAECFARAPYDPKRKTHVLTAG